MKKLAMMSATEAMAAGFTRETWLDAVRTKPRPRRVTATPRISPPVFTPTYPCVHRGGVVEKTKCNTCGGKSDNVDVHACTKHGKCTIRTLAKDKGFANCQTCEDRTIFEREIAFADWMNKYKGEEAWVIGSGPTTFDFESLADIQTPIFFINNAAHWQQFARHDNLFWFALDRVCQPWLPSLRGTAVLDLGGQWGHNRKSASLLGGKTMTFWTNTRGLSKGANYKLNQEYLMQTRERLADTKQLYKFMITLMPLTHFAWYAGFERLNLVGCDGICSPDAMYDSRLIPHIRTGPPQFRNYGSARIEQERMMDFLGIESNYVGTPTD